MNINLEEIKEGITKANVFRKVVSDSGHETITKIHEGVVVAIGSSYLRIYNPKSVDNGGDVSIQTSEWFPISSKLMWIELAGELKKSDKINIPADL